MSSAAAPLALPLGTRAVFTAVHWSVKPLSGHSCTIVGAGRVPLTMGSQPVYRVRFDDGRELDAVECELVEEVAT